jgi:hypothetical protein
MNHSKILFVATALSVAALSSAASVVAPNAYANTSGDGQSFFIMNLNARRMQFAVGADQLSAFTPGTKLTSISFRTGSLVSTSTNTSLSYSSWNLKIGTPTSSLAGLGANFANNISNAVTVRSGALSIAAGNYPGGALTPAINPWGVQIDFQTPYTYTGGGLILEVSHGAGPGQSSITFDAVTSAAPGYGSSFRAFTATNETAAEASNTSAQFTVMKLNAVPEPGTMLALGAGLAALLRRRSARQAS